MKVDKGRPTVVSDAALQSREGCSRQDKVDADTSSEYRRAQRGCHDARKDDGLDGYEPSDAGNDSTCSGVTVVLTVAAYRRRGPTAGRFCNSAVGRHSGIR